MSPALQDYIARCQQRINAALPALLGDAVTEYADNGSNRLQPLFEAMRYSLLNGGKRVRPLLVYAAAEAVGGADEALLDAAAGAVECIHAYSLVHDDLPAMDDDELRRGQPTCHIAFDEATAILAGDALQARAFELLATAPDASAELRLALVSALAAAAGARGMVGGQAMDLGAVNQQIGRAQLETMHQLKTGALIRAAVRLGALCAGAGDSQLQALDAYGRAIGLSFQVQDDIIDIESSTETLGKTQGADQALNKPTYPALLGLDGAKALARELHDEALERLADFGENAHWLRELSAYIIARHS